MLRDRGQVYSYHSHRATILVPIGSRFCLFRGLFLKGVSSQTRYWRDSFSYKSDSTWLISTNVCVCEDCGVVDYNCLVLYSCSWSYHNTYISKQECGAFCETAHRSKWYVGSVTLKSNSPALQRSNSITIPLMFIKCHKQIVYFNNIEHSLGLVVLLWCVIDPLYPYISGYFIGAILSLPRWQWTLLVWFV